MRTRMFYDSVRNEMPLIPPVRRAPAKIHILKPKRPETLVETAQLFPNRPPDHEKRAGRLLDHLQLRIIQVQAAVRSIDLVPGPHPVEQERFQSQCRGCREFPDHEADLGFTV